MQDTGLYERVLAAVGAEGLRAKAKVRASAAVVLWRRHRGRLEVFWVQRAYEMPFMGGFHAFPGGGVDRRDSGTLVTGTPQGLGNALADGGMPESVVGNVELDELLPPGIVACALRELFEETGLLPGVDPSTEERQRIATLRKELEGKAKGFDEVLQELGWHPDPGELVYAGRWLTPPFSPVRFDNRFFLLEWPSTRAAQPQLRSGELIAGEWIDPADALDRWRREEAVAAPPILHILNVLATDGLPEGLARLHDSSEVTLGRLRRIEFMPGVLMFSMPTMTLPPATHTNTYLVGHGDGVLIDPGTPDDDEQQALLGALGAAAREGRRVREIWLTHQHPDHIGAVEAVRRELRVPVRAHPHVATLLRKKGIEVEGTLAEGQSLALNGDPEMELQVLHTPGHARGHLCFYEPARRWIFGGDLVAGVGTIVIDPPDGDMDDYLASLKRIRDLDPRALLPAHGPLTLSPAAKLQQAIDHRLWREQRILDAWNRGLRERDLLAHVYDDAPRQALPLAKRQLAAHLKRLRRLEEIGGDSESGS